MRKRLMLATALFALGSAAQAAGFSLASSEIKAGGMMPKSFEFNGFGCSGENKSTALKWAGAPAGTKSFVVTVYAPDAPTGSGWWHWVVVNIPANVTELASNAGAVGGANLPQGASNVKVDFGFAGWGGAARAAPKTKR